MWCDVMWWIIIRFTAWHSVRSNERKDLQVMLVVDALDGEGKGGEWASRWTVNWTVNRRAEAQESVHSLEPRRVSLIQPLHSSESLLCLRTGARSHQHAHTALDALLCALTRALSAAAARVRAVRAAAPPVRHFPAFATRRPPQDLQWSAITVQYSTRQ